MRECPKKPGVAFWATTVVVVALAYPLSFGPACWLADRGVLQFKTILRVYPPLYRSVWYKDDSLWSRALCWYGKVGMSSSDLQIEMKIYRAQLALTEERVANRREMPR